MVGLRPVLFLIPGHCFPGIYLPTSGKIVAVETTMVGKADFQQAAKRGMEAKGLDDRIRRNAKLKYRFWCIRMDAAHGFNGN